MAVKTIFINLIIPISKIEEKYPGGFEKCLEEHKEYLGGKVYYDNYLFRDGAMNGLDMKNIVDFWEGLGFEFLVEEGGIKKRKDCCIYENYDGGYHCDWLDCGEKNGINFVFLKNTIPGVIMGTNIVNS